MTEQQTEGDGKEQAGGGSAKTAASDGPGSATDAVSALASALSKAAHVKSPATTDPLVSAAFVLGWHMAELYERHLPADERQPPDLPGLGSLTEEQRTAIVIEQIAAGVEQLKDPIAKSGLDPVDVSGLAAAHGTEADNDQVLKLHLQLLGELTAADFRLGKAYGLGRALADSCREPSDADGLATELAPYRIANLLQWLDDLGSAFPPHAANSVAKSLMRWRDALHPPSTNSLPPSASGWEKTRAKLAKLLAQWGHWQGRDSIAAPVDAKDAIVTLRRQGDLWRALLSGEKQGTDMLETENYLDAARRLSVRAAAIARGVIIRMPLLALLVLALVGVGVWLLVEGSSAHLAAGVASILAAFGLTWKGFGGTLGKLAGRLEQPLWDAALDEVIADAITLLPGNKADALGRRQIALSALRPAISEGTTGPGQS
jgi:hypothetical protein